MDITKMLFGGALIGTLVSAWGTIKGVAWKICTIAFKKVNIDDSLSKEILNYLRENYKYFHLHDRSFENSIHFTKTDCRYDQTGWETFDNASFIFWYGKIPFYYSNYRSSTKDSNGNEVKTKGATLYYIRRTLNIEQIIYNSIHRINKITLERTKARQEDWNRFYIKYIPGKTKEKETHFSYDFTSNVSKCLSHDLTDLGFNISKDGINRIILTEENQEAIKFVELWKNNKDWYVKKDIPWKMGLLLHGPPGTGKTLLSRRIAEHLNMPLFVYRLGMLTDPEFSEEWASMQASAPCVALIEDFDNVFHGRENIVSIDNFMERFSILEDKPKEGDEQKRRNGFGHKVTFDNLLNTLDGAERYEGVLTIITTNHIDKVDAAILDRPGRIDKVIELTYLTNENKLEMIEKILGDMPIARQAAIQYINTNIDKLLTPAQLQEKCISLALKAFYNQNLEDR
jgi:hypothetical protein